MKSFSRILAAMGLLALVLSCGKNTRIAGNLHEGAGEEVIVKLLDVNRFQVLDTVKVNEAGDFSYKLDIEEGKPEFIYLFHGNRQIASLLLQKGDQVKVLTDTLGVYTVEGSEESLKLQQVESEYNAFMKDFRQLMDQEDQGPAVSRRYVAYYRDRLAYVVGNSHSLTVVPVLFQQVTPNMAVFSQPTDGILMRNICDSLKTVYPESRYVKALEKEAGRRLSLLDMNNRLKDAKEVGYIDINLPGIDGKNVQLSESLKKVTMVYFWSSTAAGQKMFNLDALAPIYEQYKDKGFEIYAVSLDADKSAWAAAVRNQALPWVNVCDTRGAQSPYVVSYGIGSLPMAWFIVDGTVDQDAKVRDAASLKEYLRRTL